MTKYAQPVTKRDMRAFLGTVRKFVKNFCEYSTPAVAKSAPVKVNWTHEMRGTFTTLRSVLCNVCALHVPSPQDVFIVETDASKAGVGGVLNVLRERVMLPVGFYSRQLRGAEHNYSATELKDLAVYCTVMHFSHYLYGCVFTVITDHKPLEGMNGSKLLNRRLQSWTIKLMDFSFIVQEQRMEQQTAQQTGTSSETRREVRHTRGRL